MGVPVKPSPQEDKEDWLVTYADAITLLMAFFVMLLTFAEYDIPSFEEAAAAIKKEVGGGETTSPTTEMQIAIQDVVYNMEADQVVDVSKDSKGLVIELASNAFYKPGSAEIREAAIPVLEKMAQTIKAPRYDFYLIEIEGHTDDDPISTAQFPSNWELSTSRATRIVRFLEDQGFLPTRLKATGYGQTKPKVPNRDQSGKPIKENQAINRRVNIRVTPMSLEQRAEFIAMGEMILLEEPGAAETMGGDEPMAETSNPTQDAEASEQQ